MALLTEARIELEKLVHDPCNTNTDLIVACKTLADEIGSFPVTTWCLSAADEELENRKYADSRLTKGKKIDGLEGSVGDIVFWTTREPYWIVEWQPDNGEVFAIVNAKGEVGLAGADELTRNFRNRRQL